LANKGSFLFYRVFQKEIKEILRDKRTLFAGLMLPAVLFPAIIFFVQNVVDRSRDQVQERMVLAVGGAQDSRVLNHLEQDNRLELLRGLCCPEVLDQGRVYLCLYNNINAKGVEQVRLRADNSSRLSLVTLDYVRNSLQGYQKALRKKKLALLGPAAAREAITIQSDLRYSKEKGAGLLLMATILPLLLLTYSAIASLPFAADSGAGEKERGTMEVLLATTASRGPIVIGKFLAVSVAGAVSLSALLAGFAASMHLSPDFFGGQEISLGLSLPAMVMVAALALGLTMVFALIHLNLALFSRSIREAQIFALPVMLLSMASGYAVHMLNARQVADFYLHIPLINIALTIKELALGVWQWEHLGWVFLWIALYLVAFMALSLFLIRREGVILRA
jgi:sodium transport system permease protein